MKPDYSWIRKLDVYSPEEREAWVRYFEEGSEGSEDEVNPSHYKRSIEGLGVEVIEILEYFFGDDPLLFNAGKYLLRAGHKGDLVTDLEKLIWYVQRRIDKE